MADWQDKLALVAQRNRQEIVNAKLSRREMLRAGLLTAAGTLLLKSGLSSRAHGQSLATTRAGLIPPSPPHTPWVQPLPILPIKTPIRPDQMTYGYPDGTTLTDGASRRILHQNFTYNPNTQVYGGKFPPRKFYEVSAREARQKFHPSWNASKIWGFDGRYPGPRFNTFYGEPTLVRFNNQLPSRRRHVGFGMPEMTVHLHNAHSPSESDGNPVDYFNSINDPNEVNPFGFKDYHYSNVYAGYTARNDLVGDPNEALGSLWYHDHREEFTAQNVVRGLVGAHTIFDARDTNDEFTGLRLPSGEYDVPLVFGDFMFDADHQVVFDLFNTDGVLGDKFSVNGAIQPFFNVKPRRYRLRFYNHGPARWYNLALWDGARYLPFWQIAADGNLLPRALQKTSVGVAVAERVDIIVDFSKIQSSRIYLVNRQEQRDGRGPTGDLLNPGTPLIQINKVGGATVDGSRDPTLAPLFLRSLPDPDFGALLERASRVKTRIFTFNRTNGAWAVNGKLFDRDAAIARVDQESEEVWVFRNVDNGWSHPVHTHFEEGRILTRNGVPTPTTSADYSRKDVINLNKIEEVRVFMRFRDMKGRYVTHCHNTIHEDGGMMFRWDIV